MHAYPAYHLTIAVDFSAKAVYLVDLLRMFYSHMHACMHMETDVRIIQAQGRMRSSPGFLLWFLNRSLAMGGQKFPGSWTCCL